MGERCDSSGDQTQAVRAVVSAALLICAFYLVHFLVGGTRAAFALAALAFTSVAAVLPVLLRSRIRRGSSPVCIASGFAFAAYIVVRDFASPVAYLARGDLLLLLLALTVYLAVVCCVTDNTARTVIALALLLLGSVHVGVGIFQYVTSSNVEWFGLVRGMLKGRVSGLFVSPNHLAGFLEVMIVVGASLSWWAPWRPAARIFVAYLTAIMVAGLVLSQSRAGYFSSACALLVFSILTGIALQSKRRMFAAILGAVAVLAVAAVFFAPVIGSNSVLGMRVRQRIAAVPAHDARADIWKAAVRQIGINPVFGSGSGTFLFYGRQFREPSAQTDPIHAHNDYLELIAEFGLLGLGLFLLLLVAHIRNGWNTFRRCVAGNDGKRVRNGSRALALTIAALAAVAAYVVHSFFDFNMHIPANAMLVAFVFGILANPAIASGSEPQEVSLLDRFLPYAAPAVAAAGIFLVAVRLPVECREEKARLALRDQNYKRALSRASAGVKLDPAHADLWYYLGEAYRNLAENEDDRAEEASLSEQAVAAYRAGLKSFPQDSRLLLTLAIELDSRDRFDEADAAFREALVWDPNWSAIHAYYGLDFEHRKMIPEAKVEYQKALALGNALNGSLDIAIGGLSRFGVPIVLPKPRE